MTDFMDGTDNRAAFWPLAIATMVITAIAAKVRATVDAQVPEGYENESAFHFGVPTFKN